MEKVIKFCSKCEEGFADRFNFCPNCASELIPAEIKPISNILNKTELPPEKPRAKPITSEIFSNPEIPIYEEKYKNEMDNSIIGKQGITRRWYFVGMMVISFGSSIYLDGKEHTPENLLWVWVVTLAIVVFLVYERLKNIGIEQRWLAFLTLLPIINLLVLIPCLVFQEDYYESNKLDTNGKIIAAILILAVVVPVLMLLL